MFLVFSYFKNRYSIKRFIIFYLEYIVTRIGRWNVTGTADG